MRYKECIDFLFNSLPMYQRVGGAAYKADLSTTSELLRKLGNPQNDFKSVHVAGTNGKGSVSHVLASILQEAGFSVGLYTSPHLRNFRERIRVNGKMISNYHVIRFVEENKAFFEELKPSFFEMTVALAFHYFAMKKVDIAVVEVGMGGRLDSTNVINPELSIITNISLDHTQFLGKTLDQIAREKAGIIKEGVPVVIGETQPETLEIFKRVAGEKHSEIIFADQIYRLENVNNRLLGKTSSMVFDIYKNESVYMSHVISPLTGDYQRKNFQTIVAAYDILFRDMSQPIQTFKRGVGKSLRAGLKGRWQQLNESPLCIADTGHNAGGIRYVVEQLKSLHYKNLRIVFGMVNDKDTDSVLSLLPEDAIYYFTNAHIPRALDAALLKKKAEEFGLKGNVYSNVKKAYNAALRCASKEDVIFVGGSTFVVAEII